jgi:hypothetical protein
LFIQTEPCLITYSFIISCFFYCFVQILTVKVPSSKERDDWWRVFYQGPAFSTLARFLLLGNVFFSHLLNCCSFLFKLFAQNNIGFCFPCFSHMECNSQQMLPPTGWLVSPSQLRNMFMMFSLFADSSPRCYRYWFLFSSRIGVMILILMLWSQILKGMIWMFILYYPINSFLYAFNSFLTLMLVINMHALNMLQFYCPN